MDETGVHHFTPESKQQTKNFPTGEVMASVFGNADGILIGDYLQKGQTINGTYYASLK